MCARCGVRGLVRVDDARVDGAVEVDVDVVFRDGRLGMDRDGRLLQGPLVGDFVDDRNREAQARRRRVAEFAEALDLPLLGLGHHEQDGVPVAAISADGDFSSL